MTSRGTLLAAMALLSLALCRPLAAADLSSIRYEDGKLWMNVRDAPPSDFLKALAQKTGVRFVVDAEVKPGPVTLSLEGMPLERAIRNVLSTMPQAAGHTMTYAPNRGGRGTRLVKVALFGPGKTNPGTDSTVYGDEASGGDGTPPETLPTPTLEDRMDKMVAAGVPRETAEKVITLTREVQKLQTTPKPGSYRAEDLKPESREKLQGLVEHGVPTERAVQMLLLQERYQDTLQDLQHAQGGAQPILTPPPSTSE